VRLQAAATGADYRMGPRCGHGALRALWLWKR